MSCDKLSLAALLLLLPASASLAAPAQNSPEAPLPSESYTRVLNALTSGKSVVVTTIFNQCTIAGTGASGPPITGGFHIRDYIVPNSQYIGFADVVEILGADNELVTKHVSYRVMPDGKVVIRSATRQTITGKPVQLIEYQCAIDKSVSFHWLGTE